MTASDLISDLQFWRWLAVLICFQVTMMVFGRGKIGLAFAITLVNSALVLVPWVVVSLR